MAAQNGVVDSGVFEESEGFCGLEALTSRVPGPKPQPKTKCWSAISLVVRAHLETGFRARFLVGSSGTHNNRSGMAGFGGPNEAQKCSRAALDLFV